MILKTNAKFKKNDPTENNCTVFTQYIRRQFISVIYKLSSEFIAIIISSHWIDEIVNERENEMVKIKS